MCLSGSPVSHTCTYFYTRTDRQDRRTDRQDRRTDRQTRQTDRQDRQTDRQTQTDRHRQTYTNGQTYLPSSTSRLDFTFTFRSVSSSDKSVTSLIASSRFSGLSLYNTLQPAAKHTSLVTMTQQTPHFSNIYTARQQTRSKFLPDSRWGSDLALL